MDFPNALCIFAVNIAAICSFASSVCSLCFPIFCVPSAFGYFQRLEPERCIAKKGLPDSGILGLLYRVKKKDLHRFAQLQTQISARLRPKTTNFGRPTKFQQLVCKIPGDNFSNLGKFCKLSLKFAEFSEIQIDDAKEERENNKKKSEH